MRAKITILGTLDASRPARAMIAPTLECSASSIGVNASIDWASNDRVEPDSVGSSDGLFIAPGAPSENCDRILEAIRLARTELIPCLGTCGGFQRIVAEYAANELGFSKIEHEELTPDATDPLFSKLKCSLVGEEAEVELHPGSIISKTYGRSRITESFLCAYGLNAKYTKELQRSSLRVTGCDSAGEARVVELERHPFFVGTLFVPQVRSTECKPHALITAFVEAAATKSGQRQADSRLMGCP